MYSYLARFISLCYIYNNSLSSRHSFFNFYLYVLGDKFAASNSSSTLLMLTKHPVCASPFTRGYLDRSSDGGNRQRETQDPSGPRLSVGSQSRDRSPRSTVQILGHWNSFSVLPPSMPPMKKKREKKKERIKLEKGENSSLPRDTYTANSSLSVFLLLSLPPSPICETVPFRLYLQSSNFISNVGETNANDTRAILCHPHTRSQFYILSSTPLLSSSALLLEDCSNPKA